MGSKMSNIKEQYEYIVIGGGSAGCVIVNRLAKAGKKVIKNLILNT